MWSMKRIAGKSFTALTVSGWNYDSSVRIFLLPFSALHLRIKEQLTFRHTLYRMQFITPDQILNILPGTFQSFCRFCCRNHLIFNIDIKIICRKRHLLFHLKQFFVRNGYKLIPADSIAAGKKLKLVIFLQSVFPQDLTQVLPVRRDDSLLDPFFAPEVIHRILFSLHK